MGISWKGNKGGGGGGVLISVTTIDKGKGRWGIHSFFLLCVCVGLVFSGVGVSA